MFRFFFKNLFEFEPDAFGLDVSDESFKFAQLKMKKGGGKLAAFGAGDFPKGLIVDGEIRNEPEVLRILKTALEKPLQGRLTTRSVVCSLPEEHSFVRVLQLPLLGEGEIKEAVAVEIEQNIPIPVSDAYYDYQVVSRPDQKLLRHLDVLVSVAPKKLVDGYVSLLQNCGLRVKALELESVAASRALIGNLSTDDPVLIVDLGATRTSFIIFSGSALQFTSSVPVAGNKMIDAIAEKCKVDQKEAKRLFYDVGLDKTADGGQTFSALEPFINDLADQIRNYISFYESHSMHDHRESGSVRVKKVLVCGGVSNLTGLTVYLSLTLKIPVEVGNPWSNILKPPLREVPGMTFRASLGYTTALGLALSGLQKIG